MVDNIAIKTGVDRLVELVEQKREVSMSDASKMLGVPVSVVEEWTDFLEEKGVVKVKYKFTVPYIIKVEIGRTEIQKRGKEFESKKESVLRNVEVSIGTIKEELDYVSALKNEFLKLSKEITASEEPVKKEIAILERFDNLKKNLEKDLLNQQAIFKKSIGELEKQAIEKRTEFSELKDEIEKTRILLKKETDKAVEMKRDESAIQEQLDTLLDKQKMIAANLSKQNAFIIETQDRLEVLKQGGEKIGVAVAEKFEETNALIHRTEEQKNGLVASQQKLLDTLSAHHAIVMNSASDYKALMAKTMTFFSKKEVLEKGFESVSNDLVNFNKDIREILKETRMLNALSKSANATESIKHLEDRMKDLEIKRGEFQKKVTTLVTLFHKTTKE